ncbi:hypothetical protein NC99_23690 [Sunxiuqinia dokdonensis]|uniref:Uncharacterized protein n=1 Tax=Sunxiuqinia dokdonensis TaxID=1409788 RepID=A0A0L8V9G1_9BACT|nr:hypothetical protein NC99_23690 [Sunxiuqinia dokdonensis]
MGGGITMKDVNDFFSVDSIWYNSINAGSMTANWVKSKAFVATEKSSSTLIVKDSL